MKNSKLTAALDIIVIFVANFCIFVFGIWISAIPITKSKSFYMRHFNENENAKYVLECYYHEDPMTIMEKTADITINYYFGNEKEYQIEVDGVPFFNEYEVRHMADVKELYIKGQIIAVISFFTLLACLFYMARWFRRLRKKVLIYTGCFYGLLFILVGAFLLWGYIDYKNGKYDNGYFVNLFINFHHLIFWNNDKFLLATSQGPYSGALYTLTTILDTRLFMDAGITIAITTLSVILLWFATIIVFYRLHPKITRKVDEIHERARSSQKEFNQTSNR